MWEAELRKFQALCQGPLSAIFRLRNFFHELRRLSQSFLKRQGSFSRSSAGLLPARAREATSDLRRPSKPFCGLCSRCIAPVSRYGEPLKLSSCAFVCQAISRHSPPPPSPSWPRECRRVCCVEAPNFSSARRAGHPANPIIVLRRELRFRGQVEEGAQWPASRWLEGLSRRLGCIQPRGAHRAALGRGISPGAPQCAVRVLYCGDSSTQDPTSSGSCTSPEISPSSYFDDVCGCARRT